MEKPELQCYGFSFYDLLQLYAYNLHCPAMTAPTAMLTLHSSVQAFLSADHCVCADSVGVVCRQDFRDLVRDLYKTYRARIWMSKVNSNHR